MSAIDIQFNKLRQQDRKAFIPFVTGGDPSLPFMQKILQRLDRLGCSIGEIGIPYSDPIADGPIIQASYQRALDKKIKLDQIFKSTAEIAPQLKMPLACMVSYAIIHRRGPERFIADAQAAGFSGAIVPDILVEESGSLATACKKADFSLIQLITPTTTDQRAIRIAESSSGFIYFVAVTGITGERAKMQDGLVDRVGWLRERTELPICIGFGISRPEHIRHLAPVADGLIVGSAIVRQLQSAETDESDAIEKADALVRSLLAALEDCSTQV